jgi:hypothetical protein
MDALSARLAAERRRVVRVLGGTAAGVALAASALALTAGALLLAGGRWLELPRGLPLLLWVALGIAAAMGVLHLRRAWARLVSLPALAGRIENERLLRAGSLRGALEVAREGPLGALAVQRMAEKLAEFPGPVLAPQLASKLRRALALAAATAMAGVAGALIARQAAPDGWAAVTSPLQAWSGRLFGGVEIAGVPLGVLRGERLTIYLRAPGRREVRLVYRRMGHPWEEIAVPVRAGSAAASVGPVDADLLLYATDGRASSDTAVVRLMERPFIAAVSLRARFPAYLRRESEALSLGEPLRLPRGTLLEVSGQGSTPLTAVLLQEGRDTIQMVTAGYGFSGQLVVSRSGRYEWSASVGGKALSELPPALEIELLPDSVPQVAIVAPSGDTTVSRGDTLRLTIVASDDHGLHEVGVRSWIARGGDGTPQDSVLRLASPGEAQWAGGAAVPTERLRPGDVLHLVAWAVDGSPWGQRVESPELLVRLPSLAEQRALARESADSAVARAAAAAAAQRELEQRTAVAARDRGNRQSGSADREGRAEGERPMEYEAAQRAQALAQQQRQLAERVAQLRQMARQAEQRLGSAGALDSALQARFQEVQQLLREALTEDLAAKLRQLEEAAAKLSQEEARRALADLTEQQRRLREQLDRSVELLKRAALEGALSTLSEEARELAREERKLADSLGGAGTEEERQRAREMAERARELAQDMRALEERLRRERAQAAPGRVAEAQRQAQESARQLERVAPEGARASGSSPTTAGQSRDSTLAGGRRGDAGSRSASEGGTRRSDASEAARLAAEAMDQAATQLTQARQEQVSEWKEELTAELDRSVQEMLQLARQQQALQNQVRAGTAPSDIRSQQGALQQGAEASTQRLQEAAQRSSLISQRTLRAAAEARRMVTEATRQAQSSNVSGSQVASAMQEASQALTEAAASLVRDRQRVQSAASASGFAEMLKELEESARQQSALNAAVQQLIPLPGRQPSAEAQQRAQELSRAQREVAARLDEVSDRDLAGRTEELAREAKQIAQALALAQLDQSVVERQQRLFRKMLDAGRLLEEDERDDSGKREARSWMGGDVYKPGAAALPSREALRFRPPSWEELRGLGPEERRIVLEYFRKLNGGRP